MGALFVRDHDAINGNQSGLNVAVAVPIGNTLIVSVGLRSADPNEFTGTAATVTSLSKPGSETANWVKLSPAGAQNVAERVEFWAIRTTVAWAPGYEVVPTYSEPSSGEDATIAMTLSEFTGVTTALRSTAPFAAGNANSPLSVNLTGAQSGDLILGAAAYSGGKVFDGLVFQFPETVVTWDSDNTGGAWSAVYRTASPPANEAKRAAVGYQYKIATTAGAQTFDVVGNQSTGKMSATGVVLAKANTPPNVATLTSLHDGSVIDVNKVQRASHVFSDADSGDVQGGATYRHRVYNPSNPPAWTVIDRPGDPNTFYDYPAGTFVVGVTYERQALPRDQDNVPAPAWSSSGFFVGGDAPDTPNITSPTQDQQVGGTEPVEWDATEQDEYRIRRVADNAGDADPSIVYFDTGFVPNPAARSRDVPFETNDRTEHVQVQTRHQGIESLWDSVRVEVFFEPPPTPTRALAEDTGEGSILVTPTNPPSTGVQPPTAYNEFHVDDGDGKGESRRAILPPNTSWLYRRPRSNVDYEDEDYPASGGRIRVVAVGVNGGTASS